MSSYFINLTVARGDVADRYGRLLIRFSGVVVIGSMVKLAMYLV